MKSMQMSGANALALLEGRKTQTRRLSKLRKVNTEPNKWELIDCILNPATEQQPGYWAYFRNYEDLRHYQVFAKWQEHDIFLVKEPWKLMDDYPINIEINGDVCVRVQYITDPNAYNEIWFTPERYAALDIMRKAGTKPAMFMPQEVSRFRLEIQDVRIERAADISAEDIGNEGIILTDRDMSYMKYPGWSITKRDAFPTPHKAWESLWNGINKNCKLSKNPWVWVVEFSTSVE